MSSTETQPNTLTRAFGLYRSKRFAEALELAQEVRNRQPEAALAWYLGDVRGALTALAEQLDLPVELEAAFDDLPEHYREVVTLSRIAQLSRAEIARQMGRTEASVRNLLSRALIALAHRGAFVLQ